MCTCCRALAQKLQIPLLTVDGTSLKLDSSDDSKEEAPPSLSEEMFDRPPGLTDAFDLSGVAEAGGGSASTMFGLAGVQA